MLERNSTSFVSLLNSDLCLLLAFFVALRVTFCAFVVLCPMPLCLTFMMGNHPAPLPGDLRYCKNHMWCRPGADGVHTFGFTAYAVRLMQDVYFLEWRIEPGLVTAKQEIGFIETQKATSGLYAPLGGRIVRFNSALLDDPGTINLDNYGAVGCSTRGELARTL